jgi:predicted transcriptional regulator
MAKEKDQVIEMIRSLPDDSTVDDIMEELYFRMQVDRGLKELDEGKGIEHQDVRKRLSRWLEK